MYAIIQNMAREMEVLKSKVAEVDNNVANEIASLKKKDDELLGICSNIKSALVGERNK